MKTHKRTLAIHRLPIACGHSEKTPGRARHRLRACGQLRGRPWYPARSATADYSRRSARRESGRPSIAPMTSATCRAESARRPVSRAIRCSARTRPRQGVPLVRVVAVVMTTRAPRQSRSARRKSHVVSFGEPLVLFRKPLSDREATPDAERLGGHFQARSGLLAFVLVAIHLVDNVTHQGYRQMK